VGYLLGSDSETLVEVSPEHGGRYQPVGLFHAVDEATLPKNHNVTLAYAVCGQPVRVWHEPFAATTGPVHEPCADNVRNNPR